MDVEKNGSALATGPGEGSFMMLVEASLRVTTEGLEGPGTKPPLTGLSPLDLLIRGF